MQSDIFVYVFALKVLLWNIKGFGFIRLLVLTVIFSSYEDVWGLSVLFDEETLDIYNGLAVESFCHRCLETLKLELGIGREPVFVVRGQRP